MTEIAKDRYDQRLSRASNLTAKGKESGIYLKVLAELFRREVAQISELPTPPSVVAKAEDYLEIETSSAENLTAHAEEIAKPSLQFSPAKTKALTAEQEDLADEAAEARDRLGLAC